MNRVVAVALVAAALSTTACNDDSPSEKAVADTEAKLDDIESGRLEFELLASTLDEEGEIGFSVAGPFAIAKSEGLLPEVDLEYTRITGERRRTTKFVSTGKDAFVELDGRTWKLGRDQVDALQAEDSDTGGGGLEGLDLTGWIETSAVAERDGSVDRVTGKLDAIPALNDILGLAHEFGAGEVEAPEPLEGENADVVERAVRRATYTLDTTDDERFLRRFEAVIDLALDEKDDLSEALGTLAGARLRLVVAVDDVNEPVRVRAPANARPISQR